MVTTRMLAVCGALFFARGVSGGAAMAAALRSVDFEVFGRVQGVFFRKSTREQANQLGLRGWCKNTAQGTVQGSLQGPTDQVTSMMDWLKTKGSPSSHIDKAEFRNDKQISDYTYKNFDIVKD